MERTLNDIDNEMFEIENRINDNFEQAHKLNAELKELQTKLHALKEEKFEVCNGIKKGDIIQDINGVQYYYQGFSKEWYGYPFLVSKVTKSGKPSKNTMHVVSSKFNLETIKPSSN